MLLVKDSSREVAVMIYYITMIELWQEWQTSKITIKMIIIWEPAKDHKFDNEV